MAHQSDKDVTPSFFGLKAAADFIGLSQQAITGHARAGKLSFIRDSSGKKLFTLKELKRFKRSYKPGNRNRRTYDAGEA